MCGLRAERCQVAQDLLGIVEGRLDAVVYRSAGEYLKAEDKACWEDESPIKRVSISEITEKGAPRT